MDRQVSITGNKTYSVVIDNEQYLQRNHDLPSVIILNEVWWCRKGKLHRCRLPALIKSQYQEYFIDGKTGRNKDNFPSYLTTRGTKHFYKNDKLTTIHSCCGGVFLYNR